MLSAALHSSDLLLPYPLIPLSSRNTIIQITIPTSFNP